MMENEIMEDEKIFSYCGAAAFIMLNRYSALLEGEKGTPRHILKKMLCYRINEKEMMEARYSALESFINDGGLKYSSLATVFDICLELSERTGEKIEVNELRKISLWRIFMYQCAVRLCRILNIPDDEEKGAEAFLNEADKAICRGIKDGSLKASISRQEYIEGKEKRLSAAQIEELNLSSAEYLSKETPGKRMFKEIMNSRGALFKPIEKKDLDCWRRKLNKI